MYTNSILLVTIITILPSLFLAFPQRQANQRATVTNDKISAVNEINALEGNQQSNSAVVLIEMRAKLREVSERLDKLIGNQLSTQQLPHTKDPIPFRPNSPPSGNIIEQNRNITETSAANNKKIDKPERDETVVSVKLSTTTPATITAVLERPFIEIPTQPMVRISDAILAINSTGGRDKTIRTSSLGIVSGRY